MVEKRTWEEFRESKLLWWINQTLHLFGWAIVYEFKDGVVSSVYPARVKFRGFGEDVNTDGYTGLTKYIKENIDELEKDTNS